MKKTAFLLMAMVFFGTTAFAGKVELTTYYPAPYGEYNTLKLSPGTTYARGVACTSTEAGMMYYNTTTKELLVCNGATWGAGSGTGVWTANGNNIYNSNSGNVGIGTTSPGGTLDVQGGTAAAGISGTRIRLFAQNGGTGNTNGGNIVLDPGAKSGTGSDGIVNVNGAIAIRGGNPAAGKVLISDADGDASWQTNPAAPGFIEFGGMYQMGPGGCESGNPVMGGACSCPAGFTNSTIGMTCENLPGVCSEWDQDHFCWRQR